MRIQYDELLPALKRLLPDERLDFLGRAVRFIRRMRTISACALVWATVLSRFGSGKPGFEQARHWYERLTGFRLWPRPFQVRFKSPAAVRLFEQAFRQAISGWADRKPARHRLAKMFTDIIAWDSTVMHVADELQPLFQGTRHAKAMLKAVLGISVWGMLPVFASVVPGSRNDNILGPSPKQLKPGTLVLFDKGFGAVERLRSFVNANIFFLCPMRLNGHAHIVQIHRAPSRIKRLLRARPEGLSLREVLPKKKRVRKIWDLQVLIRPAPTVALSKEPVAVRLVIMPGPKGQQHPYLTNLSTVWKPAALRELYRLRWQIELVFKELKQYLNLRVIPTKDPFAAQCFVWASLLALVLSRAVATWLVPLPKLTGLSAELRPMVLTRALRSNVRLLARAMAQRPKDAAETLRFLAEELLIEARQLARDRDDSFRRLPPLVSRAA